MVDTVVATWKRRETAWRKSRLLQLCRSAHWLLSENTGLRLQREDIRRMFEVVIIAPSRWLGAIIRHLHWLSATYDAPVRTDLRQHAALARRVRDGCRWTRRVAVNHNGRHNSLFAIRSRFTALPFHVHFSSPALSVCQLYGKLNHFFKMLHI